MTTCPKTAREGCYLLTCCLAIAISTGIILMLAWLLAALVITP